MTLQEAFDGLKVDLPQTVSEDPPMYAFTLEHRDYRGHENSRIIGAAVYCYKPEQHGYCWGPYRATTSGVMKPIQTRDGMSPISKSPKDAIVDVVTHFVAYPHVEGLPYVLEEDHGSQDVQEAREGQDQTGPPD